MMKKAKGTFWMRAGILLLAVLFGILVYWSLGFVLDDIRVFKFPDRKSFFDDRRDPALATKLEALESELRELNHKHELLNQQRGFIKDSSSSLQIVVDNLFKLKNREQQLISEAQFGRVLNSLDKVIAIQDDYKTTADSYIDITNAKYEVQKKIAALKKQLEAEDRRINNLYSQAVRRQRIKTAILQLSMLVPLALAATVLLVKKRSSVYRMIFVSSAVAIYWKTGMFMHEHFPTRSFKYIIMGCLLVLVAWGFVWLIRNLTRPKLETLLKQYRQAYERFLCPVCEYPIRRGPRKYLYWTRRTVHKVSLNSGAAADSAADSPYICPACGTRIFEKCSECGAVRHSLLPACHECGHVKPIGDDQY